MAGIAAAFVIECPPEPSRMLQGQVSPVRMSIEGKHHHAQQNGDCQQDSIETCADRIHLRERIGRCRRRFARHRRSGDLAATVAAPQGPSTNIRPSRLTRIGCRSDRGQLSVDERSATRGRDGRSLAVHRRAFLPSVAARARPLSPFSITSAEMRVTQATCCRVFRAGLSRWLRLSTREVVVFLRTDEKFRKDF